MKANFLSLLFYLLIPFTPLLAQDTLYTKKGDIIVAKVIEVNSIAVKYKKLDYQDGPTFVLNKKDIFMIHYSNGSKDIFSNENNPEENDYANPNPVKSKKNGFDILSDYPISIDGYHYSIGYLNLNPKKTDALLLQKNNKQLNLMVKNAESQKRISKLMAFAPIPFGCGAYLALIAGSVSGNRYSTGIPSNYWAVSGLLSLAAIGSGATSIVLNVKSKRIRLEAVKYYNLTYFGSRD